MTSSFLAASERTTSEELTARVDGTRGLTLRETECRLEIEVDRESLALEIRSTCCAKEHWTRALELTDEVVEIELEFDVFRRVSCA